MNRRDFVTLLGGAAAAWSLTARAQQSRLYRVGILSDYRRDAAAAIFTPFARGLRDAGYIEGQNIAFEIRYSEGKNEILPTLARDLIGHNIDVIVAIGTPAAKAAKAATEIVPVVFARIADPIEAGLVDALARPVGNVTGLSLQSTELSAKRLELIKQVVPGITHVGVLWESGSPQALAELHEIEQAAQSLKVRLVIEAVPSPDDFAPSISSIAGHGAGAILFAGSPLFTDHREQLAELAIKARLPTMSVWRAIVEAGGLMSYGTNYFHVYRRAAAYVDKILKGVRPADLPIEQPTKFELVINLKTARTLGLEIPANVLALADEVIE
jgi:putative ABC transport system substrate-binding protein